ncbi:MAG TPA: biopolymer transporter ExbD [Pseudomonadales bacterium]
MKESRRTRRMQRHHRRNQAKASLNLVSLMDIFTILVFFLLVNSADTQQLPNAKTIALPTSTAEQFPEDNLTLMVNKNDILVQGRKITTTDNILKTDEPIISALKKELEYRASKQGPLTPTEKALGRPITIMGDKTIPYELLKKIMVTCSESGFPRISLAVIKKSEEKPS